MSEQGIVVRVDDRVRLMTALLARTNWPEQEQAARPHGVHAHARATHKHLEEFGDHAAVERMQGLLDGGRTLAELFGFALGLSWPGLRARGDVPEWVPSGWTAEIRNFHIAGKLASFWQDEKAIWDEAMSDLEDIFAEGDVAGFLTPYLGQVEQTLVFMPNLSYPTAEVVGLMHGEEIWCVAPPQLATGTNPPWPYKDDPAWAVRTAFEGFATVLVMDYLARHDEAAENLKEGPLPVPEAFREAHPDWQEQFARIFVGAATAIYLEETAGGPEAEAFIMMEHKTQGFDILPGAVSVLRRYLNEREAGKFTELADFLPVFRNHLRVAARLLRG